MKQLLLTTVLLLALTSCSGRKHIETAISHGNYDQAISNALNKLETSKNKKRKQDYIIMLEDAYYKALAQDLNTINHLKKDGNPEQYKAIYEIYTDLENRQNAIKAVLPLKIGNRLLNLKFNNYINDIVDYRYKTSDYLIDKGITLLDSDNKYNAREAYSIFEYIENINPNFEETRELLNEAHQKGINHVLVSIENQTQQIIPRRLENDLLDFNTYGLNDFWTAFHVNKNASINYDFAMQLQLKQIQISPEHVSQRQILRKKQIIDGWKYKLDLNGNVEKDSLGNDIKIDKIITAKARLFEFNQTKSTRVIARVEFINLKSNQLLDTFPIDSEFLFENQYATVKGDRRALDKHDRILLKSHRVQFPSNEQMIYDTGEDLKYKLKNIINRYNFKG
jgi:hypothetical protein